MGVELEEGAQVLEGVLLQHKLGLVDLLGVDHGLDLIGVDETGQVRVGHLGPRQLVALLQGGGGVGGT